MSLADQNAAPIPNQSFRSGPGASGKTQVLIVGAGPTGLSLAAQLQRYGIEFVIIDKKEGITDLSKALVVQARTMELFDQIGLAKQAHDQGEPLQRILMLSEGKIAAHPDFSQIGARISEFPYFLVLEQSKTERLLHDYIKEAGDDVYWNTELLSLNQAPSGVTATIKTSGGEDTIAADYLVGCDGASSVVRHQLDLGFEGSTFPRLFYVADVEMDFEIPEAEFRHDSATIVAALGDNSYVLLAPLAGDRHWRFTGNLPDYNIAEQDKDIPFSEIEARVRRQTKRDVKVDKVNWFSKYKVHTRNVDHFRVGRCFVAGDSAHVHTPAGGQGMNTGIQDGYNLAWKLALALRAGAPDALLDTYNEERLANARHLVRSTDQFFDVMAGDSWYMQLARRYIVPLFASAMTSFAPIREMVFPMMAETAVNYRDQSLGRARDPGGLKVKAGDRMPYFKIEGVSLYHRLHAPKFHAIVFSGGEAAPRPYNGPLSEWVDVTSCPINDDIKEIFGTSEPFVLLLRPDNYVATHAEGDSFAFVENYLTSMLSHSEKPSSANIHLSP